MKVLGISPLDKDATATLVEDGKVLFAAAEERYSRKKQHAGFPAEAITAALDATGSQASDIDRVAYPFFAWQREVALIERGMQAEAKLEARSNGDLRAALRAADTRVPDRDGELFGLAHPNQRMRKGALKEFAYAAAGASPWLSKTIARRGSQAWARAAADAHRRWNEELTRSLNDLGLGGKLKRYEHHLSHAANSYLASGFDRALILTLDGYGSGLSGSVSLGEGGDIRRLRDFLFPFSLGTYYEAVTSSLGYNPTRHGGKIVGLAAYGDPEVLGDVLLSRFDRSDPGDLRMRQNLNLYFSRHLAARFPVVDVAAAYQYALEVVVAEITAHWARETSCDAVVLSGGVVANVKMNQRIHEAEGVARVFVYPNMGDGGCGTGVALLESLSGNAGSAVDHVYYGPEYDDREIAEELDREGLEYTKEPNLAAEVARLIHDGKVVARFDGKMEYGPRALGNRSILYHAREPHVNQWLNQRLGRTEFMPFAPVTLYEERGRCYEGVAGAELAAQFMTITFDCTNWMREHCPAAVHVDGTARPQLIRREVNPGYYDIVHEYQKLSGIPCLINTSFNMHEEPIVCSPRDAIRAFVRGDLDVMAIGPFLVRAPDPDQSDRPRE